MNENKKLMPERFYSLDNTMSLEKIALAKLSQNPIIGKITYWDSVSSCLRVDLGNNISGFIPIKLASIYPALSDNMLTASVRMLIGKNVVVTVEDFSSSTHIVLSRKETMQRAFKTISNSIGQMLECCIISYSNLGIFVDVGNGITGLINYYNLATSRINDFTTIGLKIGDKITAKVLSVDDKFHVNLNYKDQFENLAFKLNEGDLIEVTVLKPINCNGYFAYLNPNTSAVVDIPCEIPCEYGDKILARVKGHRKNRPDNLKLAFVSFS